MKTSTVPVILERSLSSYARKYERLQTTSIKLGSRLTDFDRALIAAVPQPEPEAIKQLQSERANLERERSSSRAEAEQQFAGLSEQKDRERKEAAAAAREKQEREIRQDAAKQEWARQYGVPQDSGEQTRRERWRYGLKNP